MELGSALPDVAPQKLEYSAAAKVTENWSPSAKKAMRMMIDKYGQPDEVSASQLVWHNNGVWRRTIVHAEEIQHNFPRPHNDVLEQVISYRAPVDKFDDLAAFDGSIAAQRTAGELSVRCDREEMNLLALNVANEIASGQRSVEDARRFVAQTTAAFMAGETTNYTRRLLFTPPPAERTMDRDRPLITDVVRGYMKGPPVD